MKMAELKSGVLVRFLQELDVDGNTIRDCRPVLLQIRSIIPVLREGNLWPNQGFFLKVSDLTHALYASLPQEQDEMVLCDKLHLGQFIYVEKLEAAYPVPMLKGIRPLPGRHPCLGNPKELLSVDNLISFSGASSLETIIEDVTKEEATERPRSLSASKASSNDHESNVMVKKTQKSRSASASRFSSSEGICRTSSNYNRPRKIEGESNYKGLARRKSMHLYEDSDMESTITSTSSSTFKRRSWNGEEATRIEDKHELERGNSNPSIPISPIPSWYVSSDDNSSSKTKGPVVRIPKRSSKISSKSSISVTGKISDQDSVNSSNVNFSLPDNKSWTDTSIAWDFLPSTLVKLGQEVLRQRDIALLAAVEALQEASAAERLLKCLSTYSQLLLAKGNDQRLSVDKFFNLEDAMAHTRLILQSLTSINRLKTADNDAKGPGSVGESLKIALCKKQNATSWIKAALASDLNPIPDGIKTKAVSSEATNREKSSLKTGHRSNKRRGLSIVKKQMSNMDESPVGLVTYMDKPPDWIKGSTSLICSELADSLHKEISTWFLTNVEDFLDWVSSKTRSRQADNQAGEMMYQIKKVSDWLGVRCKDSSTLKESEMEACGRVRNKIYEILLQHVERTCQESNG